MRLIRLSLAVAILLEATVLAEPATTPNPPGVTANEVTAKEGVCHGYGLLTPLYGVSNRGPSRLDPNKRDELRTTGPVTSGIGGGYYEAMPGDPCWDKSKASDPTTLDHMWTWELFAFSEGLDPSKVFQLGVGAGVGLSVFNTFQFGVGLGFDLVRHEQIELGGVNRGYDNGLLLGNDIFGCGHSGNGAHWGEAEKCEARNFTLLFTFSIQSSGSSDDTKKH